MGTMSEDKKRILELVKEYYLNHHQENEYIEGDRIPYAGRVYNELEMMNCADSVLDFWLTAGRYCDLFEKEFAKHIGIKHCLLVNSGSSANLLAFMTLTSPLLKERAICRGDEVITVAAGFPTTISPIIQFGAVPVFVDITLPTYNIDVNMLEDAISNRTKAVMIAHTLGNPFDLTTVKQFCVKHNLWLIEDNCDALGSKYIYEGIEYWTGTLGDIGTSSFYPPHHMTMGEGGAVYTNNSLLNKIALSFRDWGRDCICPSGKDNFCGHRYDRQYGELPIGYDHKYVYSHFGYNLKATEMQASIGVAQLNKIDNFTKQRIENFELLNCLLEDLDEYLVLPKATLNSKPSWFGYLISTKNEEDRNNLVQYLETHKIQTRMLFAGNMIKHPCFDQMRVKNEGFRVVGDLVNSDYIMNHTFWIGVSPKMTEGKIKYMSKIIHNYFCDK